MVLTRWPAVLALFAAFVIAGAARAQVPPRLEPVPIAPALAELGFKLETAPPLVLHPSGCVIMFDADEKQIVCIDPVSGATKRFGRAGSGPGEFATGRQLVPTPRGGLLVFDAGRRRFTAITPDWTLDNVLQVTNSFMSLTRPTADSVLALGGPRLLDLVSVSLHDGGAAIRFSPTASDTMFAHGPIPNFVGFWILPRRAGGWYVASPWHYQILVDDDNGVRRASFGRELPPELPSPREVAAYRKLTERMNAGQNVDGIIDRFAKSPKTVIAVAPTEDGQGRLWLGTGRIRQDSTELDVFDSAGHFLGTRRVPGEVHAMTARGADLYVLVEYLAGPHEGAQGVLRYRIR